MLTLRQRPGQEERLAGVLERMRRENAHNLPGTAARYIVRSQDDPDEITLILVWRLSDMPPEGERQAALVALRADLAEVLDWDAAVGKEGPTLLHA